MIQVKPEFEKKRTLSVADQERRNSIAQESSPRSSFISSPPPTNSNSNASSIAVESKSETPTSASENSAENSIPTVVEEKVQHQTIVEIPESKQEEG